MYKINGKTRCTRGEKKKIQLLNIWVETFSNGLQNENKKNCLNFFKILDYETEIEIKDFTISTYF